MLLFCVFFFILYVKYVSCNLYTDYLKTIHVQDVFYFHCNYESHSLDTLKTNSEKSFKTSIGKIESLNLIKDQQLKIAFLMDYDCDNSQNILDEASRHNLYNDTHFWLLVTSGNLSYILEELFKQPLDLVSNVKVAVKLERNYAIYDVYNTGLYHSGDFKAIHIGYWYENIGFELSTKWKYENRLNLTGVRIRTAIVVLQKLKNETYKQFLLRDTDTHLDSMHRFNYRLVLLVRDIYNFSIDLIRTNSWGYNNNGTFDGMMGLLQRKEVDLAGSPAFWRLERANVADGLVGTWDNRPVFIFRHPKVTGSYWAIFTRPLDDNVWYYSIILNIGVCFLLYALFKHNKRRNPHDNIDANISFAFLGTIAAMCQQGLDYNTRSTTIKIVIFTLFMFSLLIYQFYSASIVSALLKESPKTMKTLKDLDESNLKVGMDTILYNIDYFRRTTDTIALNLYKTKIKTEKFINYFDAEAGMLKVKRGGFAYLGDLPVVYKYIREHFNEKEICDLVEILLFQGQKMMTSAKKGSAFKKLITIGFRRLQEHGLMDHERRKWLIPKPKCVKNLENSLFAVSITEFSTALILLACGMILAGNILIFEIVLNRYNVRKIFWLKKLYRNVKLAKKRLFKIKTSENKT